VSREGREEARGAEYERAYELSRAAAFGQRD